VEWWVYCKIFVRIGLTADAGDNFKIGLQYSSRPVQEKNYLSLEMGIAQMESILQWRFAVPGSNPLSLAFNGQLKGKT
jgi:hypothetical protein